MAVDVLNCGLLRVCTVCLYRTTWQHHPVSEQRICEHEICHPKCSECELAAVPHSIIASMHQSTFLLEIIVLTLLLADKESCAMTVENFRAVNGINRIYRCAKTEPLAGVANPRTEAEHVILRQSGLIIDLRSQSERDDEQAQLWMDRYGFEAVDARVGKHDDVNNDDDDDDDDVPPLLEKRVLRIDVQPRERIFKYMIRCWLTPADRAMAPVLSLVDPDALQGICLDALNARGLAGLNEAILETGGEDLCLALKEMTKHLETSDTSLVFHCVQGKDRYVER